MNSKGKFFCVLLTSFLISSLLYEMTIHLSEFDSRSFYTYQPPEGDFFLFTSDSKNTESPSSSHENGSTKTKTPVSTFSEDIHITTISPEEPSDNEDAAETSPTEAALPQCPGTPPKLVGPLKIEQEAKEWKELEKIHPSVITGGYNHPEDCSARFRVAIIIPFRNRESQLKSFLHHMHPFLLRQQLEYKIYVINQVDDRDFNRAMLFNVGYLEAMNDKKWDCFVFHDVDLLPEDDRNLYTCPQAPRHLSVAVDTLHYKLPYTAIFGGAVILTKDHFVKVNGFSNEFWGWGGEDDDMWNRLKHAKLEVIRYEDKIARYTMIKHRKEKPAENRIKVLKEGKKKFKKSGLNNLEYELLGITSFKLYTQIDVKLKETSVKPSEKRTRPPVVKRKSKKPK